MFNYYCLIRIWILFIFIFLQVSSKKNNLNFNEPPVCLIQTFLAWIMDVEQEYSIARLKIMECKGSYAKNLTLWNALVMSPMWHIHVLVTRRRARWIFGSP